MRDHLVFYVNGVRQAVRGRDALLSLSDYLRRRQGLVGTKIVCSEGDCGACTVLVARSPAPQPGAPNGATASLAYKPVDSCIQFLFQLDGAHIVTVEGLNPEGGLTAVQQAMVDCHGSQCGFCTPGFVMAMTGMLEDRDRLDTADLRRGLTGNLCRCTGYTPIIDAGLKCNQAEHRRLNTLYPPGPMSAEFSALRADDVELRWEGDARTHRVAAPRTLARALEFLAAHPEATIVAGATDVGVRANKSGRLPEVILDLNRIAELRHVSITNEAMRAGSCATWTAVLEAIDHFLAARRPSSGGANGEYHANGAPRSSGAAAALEEFARILNVFGAPQIRHVGTIGGNIVNASPIADSAPLLFVMEATLTLASASGERTVNITDFYRGYKLLELKRGELLTSIEVPMPRSDELVKLYKVSRRRDLDIAGFTAAVRVQLDGDAIAAARIAMGAVGPTVLRTRRTERFLAGKPLTEDTMRAAGELVAAEIAPISDVRGDAEYRRQLARNVLLKFYHQTVGELATA